MEALIKVNEEIDCLLVKLNQIPAENSSTDELVLDLQELVGKRQLLLASTFDNATAADAPELNEQLLITQSFEMKAKVIKDHRQSLLHIGRKSKRQLNVYKAIDANR